MPLHTEITTLKVLDLFSGCGGLSLGLHLAQNPNWRFETVAAIDIWDTACETYEANLGLKPSISGVSIESVKLTLKQVGKVDVVVGGPPCQGFSTSGKRSLDDPRNKLVLAYLEAVELAKPKIFLMENVVGFTTFQDGNLLREVKAAATSLGYRVRAGIVQASIVGVPQRRRRFIMVGVRDDLNQFVFPGESSDAKISSQDLDVDLTFRDGEERWTFWDAVSDLPSLNAGESSNLYDKRPQNDLQKFLRGDAKAPTHHQAVGHKPAFVEMMSYIPEGKSAMDPDIQAIIPEALRPKSGYPNSYARIRRDKPAPTITRNFTTPSSANCIHPTQNRALSIREGARCQTFPDWFQFKGSLEDQRLQIGNAVPPLLGKALGEALLRTLPSK